ncbi:hypothetical protein [Bacteroides sp.]|uniref:hypothetical protein n=1 Tax=Bacteroides sp. TaxID=29523 RepID=UPI0026229F7E|nr:hypothetical protein [Bacteroides sp.]MDD3039525.1 hypothetical protein [Bacteroides sp.]
MPTLTILKNRLHDFLMGGYDLVTLLGRNTHDFKSVAKYGTICDTKSGFEVYLIIKQLAISRLHTKKAVNQ